MRWPKLVLLLAILLIGGCTCRDGKFFIDLPKSNPTTPKVDPHKKHVLRLLIVEDASIAGRAALTPERRAILTGSKLRTWVKNHCTKDANGTPEFRLFDQSDDASGEDKIWADTLARHRDGMPYFYVENEAGGTEGALPEDADRFLQILEPFTKGE